MADIQGTNLAAPVVPFTTDDIYPTHYAEYGKGGYRSVTTKADLDKITTNRREEGMAVYVTDEDSIYVYKNSAWVNTKATTISEDSTDMQYATAKAAYQQIQDIMPLIYAGL